jgi:hypothetical protein
VVSRFIRAREPPLEFGFFQRDFVKEEARTGSSRRRLDKEGLESTVREDEGCPPQPSDTMNAGALRIPPK